MNKFQRELLDKCKDIELTEDIPLLDDIYILPTTRKHDSGYKIMYIVGLSRKKDQYYLLDTYCDVLDIGEFMSLAKDIHIDIQDNGIIHIWSNYQLFRSVFRVSSCTFEMVDRR